MRVAVYARVSTADKDQNPETQLLPLRDFVKVQEWAVYREYVDKAPATDLYHRTAWKELLEEASKKKFDILLVWRIDRAFRSVLDAATTLERLRVWNTVFAHTPNPGWTPPRPSAKPYITSPPPTPNWKGESSGKGSKRAWTGPAGKDGK